jgi:hypothetical protein
MPILDAFQLYVTDGVKSSTSLVITLGGMTSCLHLLDMAINKPFNDHVYHLCGKWLLSESYPLTLAGKRKNPLKALVESG